MFKKYQFIQLVNAVLFNVLPKLPFSEYPTNFEAYIGLWSKSVSITVTLYLYEIAASPKPMLFGHARKSECIQAQIIVLVSLPRGDNSSL